MESAIASLPARVSPEAVREGASEGLKTGHISIASEIYKVFAADSDDTKVKIVARWAESKTCEEFRKECKAAQEIADNVDKASGFVPAPDAKGADKYGPQRKVINSRLSEAKILFGVNKMNPDILKEKGYWNALQAARDWLNESGLKWDGDTKPTAERKAELKVNAEFTAAEMQVREDHPQKAGESYKEYKDRIASMVDEYVMKAKVAACLKQLQALGTKEGKDILMLAIFNLLKQEPEDQRKQMAEQLVK